MLGIEAIPSDRSRKVSSNSKLMVVRVPALADFYSAQLGMDARRILAFTFAHNGLSASWYMDDGLDPGYSLRCAELLGSLVDPAAFGP